MFPSALLTPGAARRKRRPESGTWVRGVGARGIPKVDHGVFAG